MPFPDGSDTGSLGEARASRRLPASNSYDLAAKPQRGDEHGIKKRDKPARNLRTAEAPRKPSRPVPIEAAEPQGPEVQSAPPASMRLRTLYPEAPAPGVFSR